jgi:hypothetical protein
LALETTKPWLVSFSTSNDGKTLFADVSIEFVNGVADAHSVEVKDENKQYLLTSIDMKDSAAAIRATVSCLNEHPPPSPEQETRISGTGFFVAPNRVVTNNHVVSGCTKDIQVRYPDGRPYTATISGQDPNNDLVLLQTDMDNLSIAVFRFWPRIGEQVASYGFPYSGVLSSSGNFTLGHVTSLIGVRDDTRFLQMSAPIQPGNSGGAVLDMSGSVIGVAVARLDAIAKSVPQNVNFAIQTPIVVNFLQVKGATPEFGTWSAGAERPASEVADIAKKFTVQVYCQGISSKTATGSAGPLALSRLTLRISAPNSMRKRRLGADQPDHERQGVRQRHRCKLAITSWSRAMRCLALPASLASKALSRSDGLALPIRTLARLDQDEEPGRTGGEARSRGGLGQGSVAVKPVQMMPSSCCCRRSQSRNST